MTFRVLQQIQSRKKIIAVHSVVNQQFNGTTIDTTGIAEDCNLLYVTALTRAAPSVHSVRRRCGETVEKSHRLTFVRCDGQLTPLAL